MGSVLAAPGLRAAVLSGMHRALGGGAKGVVMYAHEWMRDMPKEAWKARHTYSLWAFPQADFAKVLGEYFSFCKAYYKQHRYRGNVVNGASRLHQDRGSLFSVSYAGPMFTLEPSSSGEQGWDDFLIDFNEFASSHWRYADLQSNARAAARARGEGIRRTRQIIPRAAPAHRSFEPAAQQLLCLSFGLAPRPVATGPKRSLP